MTDGLTKYIFREKKGALVADMAFWTFFQILHFVFFSTVTGFFLVSNRPGGQVSEQNDAATLDKVKMSNQNGKIADPGGGVGVGGRKNKTTENSVTQ